MDAIRMQCNSHLFYWGIDEGLNVIGDTFQLKRAKYYVQKCLQSNVNFKLFKHATFPNSIMFKKIHSFHSNSNEYNVILDFSECWMGRNENSNSTPNLRKMKYACKCRAGLLYVLEFCVRIHQL